MEIKTCPKCGNIFECNNYNILKCACAQIPLNSKTRELMANQYEGCLCLTCLKEFAAISEPDKKHHS